MRQITFLLEPAEEFFNPVDRRLIEHPDVTPEAVLHVERLADDTLTMLARVTGSMSVYRDILSASEDVLEHAVSTDGDEGIGYSRIEPSDFTLSLFEQRETTEYVVEMPIEYTADGRQRYTIIGEEDTFAESGIATPDGVDVTIESITPYRSKIRSPFGSLTSREEEVLSTAVEAGYYRNPREATQADLGSELDISPSAVGSHLRNIEAKVFTRERS
jgi:DNA-binding CsgD family transcriptional regulator